MFEKIKAWFGDFTQELRTSYKRVTALLIASMGALQYAHDNISMMQAWMTEKEYHYVLGTLSAVVFVSHLLATARAKKETQS